MNLMLLPILVMAFFSVVEFLFPNQRRFGNQIFHIAFLAVYAIVSAKYYYGPDIITYVPFYENLPSPLEILSNDMVRKESYEIGFTLFCSVCKWLGCSFWLFSFFITTIYFGVIYKLFKKIPDHKCFALLILTLFEANILFFEFRQSLAVSLFLLSIMAFFDKKYIQYILFAVLATTFHKSAIFACVFAFAFLVLPTFHYEKKYYLLLIVCLVAFIFISLSDVIINFAALLPFGKDVVTSITHHFGVERKIQTILLTYISAMFCLYYYGTNKWGDKVRYYILGFAFFFLIAILYKYWFFLGRFRSYFIPLLIVFVISELSQWTSKPVIFKQILVLSVYFFGFFYARGLYLSNKKSDTHILSATTVLDLRHKTAHQIKNDNIQKASIYFKTEYLKNQLETK